MTGLGNGTRTCGAYTLGQYMIKDLLKLPSSQKTVNIIFFFLILVFREELTKILPSEILIKTRAFGEGNGNSLQCSCLENPRDGGAWWAAVYGVTQSWTRLK